MKKIMFGLPLLKAGLVQAGTPLILALIVGIIVLGGCVFVYELLKVFESTTVVQQYGAVGVVVVNEDLEQQDAENACMLFGLSVGLYGHPFIVSPDAPDSPDTPPLSNISISIPTNLPFYTITYGFTNGLQPWLTGNRSTTGTNDYWYGCAINYLTANSDQLAFGVTVNGKQLFFNTSTDIADTNVIVNTLPTQPVVIERSTNLLTWQPIFTNFIATNTVSQFTDSNTPPIQAFYRTRLN